MKVYGEERVNTYTTNNQTRPQATLLADGSYIVVWQSTGQDGSGEGIYGQRFTASGVPFGPEFKVNTVTNSTQDDVRIAATSDGGFVVTWVDASGIDGSSQGVIAQRFDASGLAQGSNFVVNSSTSSTQYQSSVVGYAGGFTVVYASFGSLVANPDGYDVYLRRFDNSGNQVTPETRVSTTPGNTADAQNGTQQTPDVAAYNNGNLVIVWTDQNGNDGSSYGVYGRTYDAAAGTFSDTFLVNTTTTNAQYEPSVAALSDDGFVVVWRSDNQDGSSAGVYGQRYNAAGAKVGGEFLVNQTTNGGQYQPNITGLSTGGFVVTWYNDNFDVGGTGTTADVYVREYDVNGVAMTGQVKLTSSTNSTESDPAIVDLGQGNYVVVYQDYDTVSNTYEIAQQIFGEAAELPRQANPEVGDFAGTVTFSENLVNTTPQVIDPAVSVTDPDSGDFAGGRVDLFYVQDGEATDQLGVRNEGNGFGQIGVTGNTVSYSGNVIGTIAAGAQSGANGANLVINLTVGATTEAVEELIQNFTYASTSQFPATSRTVGIRLSDGDGGVSESATITINVTGNLDGAPVVYGEEYVNTYRTSRQDGPQIAVLNDGSYVIVWDSEGQDGSSTGIYGQRYTNAGVALGNEFKINTVTNSTQANSHVAATSDGGFVVTWEDSSGVDGSGQGVIAQRFNAGGVAQGANFVVNTTTSSTQYQSAVAGYTGGFAVVWESFGNVGGNSYDIYLRRFDNAGNQVTAETRVSTTPGNAAVAQVGTQHEPDIAAYSNGNLVIVWTDQNGNDGNLDGIYGRTYNAAAGTFSDTFLVNTTTVSWQDGPSVATLSDGGFVVVWSSYNQEGASNYGVYGQRYNAAGTKVGGEFLVNETTAGGQYQPDVTGLSTGGFVVTWYNDNFDVSGTGTTSDVYIREYDTNGVSVDGQRKLISNSDSTEQFPAIADLGSGNFVVAYTDFNTVSGAPGQSTYEVAQQLFGSAAELARQANPVIGDFTGVVTFGENLVNATPQVIDGAISLEDADSADFGGGRVDLTYVQGGDVTDQLGVRNQGTGAGQIGVSGNTVSFGGVAIGTIAGAMENGVNGTGLLINLNVSATVEAVEALIQNLTYASTSQNPPVSRTVGLRVTDGDGGGSQVSTVIINLVSEIEGNGAPVVYGEEYVNTYRTSTQDGPQIAVLNDGSYVIVWDSEGQDGSSTGIYGQRYTNAGVALGNEFKINTVTTSTQANVRTAATSDGGFVVTWEDSSGIDGSGQGVIAQRFNASGVAQGANFLVNTSTSSVQYQSSVAGYAGGFTVVYVSFGSLVANPDGYDVYLRRFDNSGNQVTPETRVSTTLGNTADAQNGTQQDPDVAAYSNGNLVIVWTDQNGNDGSGYGVYGRTYNASAGTFSDTFLVNSFVTGNQYEARVATLSDGGFVVVWRSDSQDGSSAGVYAQRFDAVGVKVGGEFLVNETTAGGQYQPDVTGLSTGGFVVTWYNDNFDVSGTGTTSDVYIREYDTNGVSVDGQRKLISNSDSTEQFPAIADLGSGNFVVAYTDFNTVSGAPGQSTYEVAQQLFGSAAELARPSAAPVLDDLRTLRTLTSTLGDPNYAGNAQVIDADMHVSDVDSANFDGGRFVAQLLNGASTTEVLGIRNQGIAAGQIGVSGADVTYGGVTIGSFAGGGAGVSTLTVTFNTNANAVAARALIENITYRNTVPPAGTTDRYVGYRLSDGDGGVSAFSQVQVRIQGTFTPTNIVLDDVESAVTFTESQANAGARVDDAMQLDYSGPNTFNGGKLMATFISGTGRVDDQLSVRNEGNGVGQVGVSGGVVSYGGTNIGTISATLNGINGVNLEVTFNASATAEAIERVAESLVYSNSSEGPNLTRTLRITVSDSANVTSAVRDIGITVTPEADLDAASKLFGQQQSNTYEAGPQTDPVVGRLQGSNNGGYVIAWVSQEAQDGDSYGVFAQRYTATGSAIGPEFQVNTHTVGEQAQVAVAGLADGGYVLAWYSQTQDANSYGVYAQRYDASGVPAGGEFRANTTTSGNQYEPAIVALSGGGFVVAWRDDSTSDVRALRFASDGTAQGPEFAINTLIAGTQFQVQLSALSTGGFVAVWTNTNGDASGYGILAQRFDALGNKVGTEIAVNTTTLGTQQDPDVAGIAGGGFVAVWDDNSTVYAQRFDAAGTKLGPELVVNTTDSPTFDHARVTALDTGGFVVTWVYSVLDVFAQQFNAAGEKIDGPRLVSSATSSLNNRPDIAALTGSNYVITWAGYNQEQAGTAVTFGVYHQLYGATGSITRGAAPVVTDVTDSVTFAENTVNVSPQVIDGGISVTDSDSANFDGGRLWVSVISGYGDRLQTQFPENVVAQDQLGIRNQGVAAGQIGVTGLNVTYGGTLVGAIITTGSNGSDLVVQFNANASAQAVEAVIENLTYANTASAPVASRSISISISDGDGATSVPRVVQINVTPESDGAQPLFGNEIVNTYRPDTQDHPAMAKLADGGYVTVWQSNLQDGWGYGIHGQRYDANGVPVGSEFQANTYTPNAQTEATVIGLTGGGFVVAWRSEGQDGSGAGVYAQRFNANGVPLGAEFRVNATTGQNQYQPTLAATADGGFVVAWYYDYYNAGFTEYADIFFQRYNSSGVAVGSETRANPAGQGTIAQSQPSIAGLNGGGFVLTWTDASLDGNSNGIFGQRFDASGNTIGVAFQINSFTVGDQSDSQVVALTGGGFVVVWRSTSQDGGGSYGVFGQTYDSSGVAVGSEFRVNTNTAGNEFEPTVTALSHGGFAVAFNDDGRITVQQFNADGLLLDGEIRVDTIDNNAASSAPAIVGLNNGAFVVSYTDYYYSASGGDNTYQITQQLFGQPTDFPRQANPQLVDVTTSVTFGENVINAVPQLIDPGVGLFDADSANFDGGLLEVNYLTDYGAQDQLGIRNEGTGLGQVGVAGNVVSFGGVAIGTIISNGANGDKLTVQFNINATPEAVEQVIENLTYANTVSNPIASRTVSIRVTDGDGGASEARAVQINVTPQTDGAVPAGLERIVNSTRGGQQSEPSVARLSDGGYVVVWEDLNANDGDLYGVYGQRYDANDNAVGPEFRVNTTTANYQIEPHVVGLTGGGFVVVWRSDSQDGSGSGVYAQRYNVDGTTAGNEFRVNTTTQQNQYQAQIAATTDGGFVVTWYYDYYNAAFTELGDIFFQRYNASGVAQSVETRANPAGLGTNLQYQPSVAWNADGSGFVVVWRDDLGDGNGLGIFGQRFDSAGATLGGRFQVNAYTDSTQELPSVATLKGGGFVVVWESEGQDLGGTGIYAQRFDSFGVKVGAEFRVNTNISGTQSDPHVAALENGGWVVSWTDFNTTIGDVYVQQYNAAGQAVDGETRVNSYTPTTQQQSTIASMPDGGFVVAYTGFIYSSDQTGDGVPDGGNDTYEIRVQRFSNTAPNVSDIAVNVNEEQVFTLTYALFSSGFNDPNGQALQAIKIVTLPGEGTLRVNGVPVLLNQEIGLADLQAGLLTYQGNVDFFGLDQFRWTGSDGIAFAATPVFTSINIQNSNDGPQLEAGTNGTATEGAFFSRTIILNDSDPEGHQVTVNWGDGTDAQVYNFSNSGTHAISHRYYENATYNVQVTANDQQGLPNSIEVDSFQVVVSNAAPTISLFGSSTVEEGQVYTLDLSLPFDLANTGASINDTVSEYRIDWGDGSPLEVYTAATLPANGILTHVFSNSGNPTIRVALVDEDGIHANAGTRTVVVEEKPPFAGQLTLPASLAPGEEGLATYSYVNQSGQSQAGVLVFVQAKAALLRDPLTGQYSDTILLIGRGDGSAAIADGEAGTLEFVVRQANAPLGQAGITVSVVDPQQALDAPALLAALKPSFVPDAGWQQIYTNFLADAGVSTDAFITALANNSALIADLGAEDSSGVAALSFELEQAGDFGSIVERNTTGSLGEGWAFIGDVKLEIGADGDAVWRGSTDLDALFSLNVATAAHYIVSSSVGVSVGLGGGVSGAAPANRPVFVQNIDGSYTADTAFDGTLVKTADSYELRAANGAMLRFGSDGQLQSVVYATGREVQVTHDAQGRITGFAGDFNNTLTIVRDDAGRATELLDEYGNSTTFTYVGAQLTQVTGVAGTASFGYTTTGDLTLAAPPGGPTVGFQYDTQGRLNGMEQAGESAATISYDSKGGYTWTSTEGQQTALELAPGGVVAKVSVGGTTASELVYDASGKLVGAQLADGSQLQFGIDDQGRLLSVTDPTGATIRYSYTGDSTRPSSFIDATGTTRQFSYDNNGRLTEATWGDGSSLQFNYDAQGQISGYTNRRGDATTYDYDANGKLVSRTDAGGETVYTYDNLGRVVSATTAADTPAAGTTQIGYDSANRVTHIEYPDGRSLDYGYDAAGRRTAMTDQDGNVQGYSYDLAGRLATVSYNGSQVVAYSYDGDGRLTEEANGNGTTSTYSYDAGGQLTAIVNLATDGSESSAYRYSYDAAGQRVGMQTPHGTWAYDYDGAGQLTSAQFSVNALGTTAGLGNKSLVYVYDAAGNRTSVTEDGVQIAYISNALNQYTQVGTATYTYDADGNQISKTVNGETWTYTYNTNNRLVEITSPQGEVTQYEYDVFDNRSAMVEDGVRTEFLVDPFALGMGSPVAEYSGSERVASYLYGLNAIAQQTSAGTYYFDGDAVGSVTGVTGVGGTAANAYLYDPFGRRLLESETVANRLEFNGLFGVEETDAGLNYMRARFYDAEQGRFTAEDPLWIAGDANNLSRFALNNPISFADPNGEYALPIAWGIGLFVLGYVATQATDIPFSKGIPNQSLAWLKKILEPFLELIDQGIPQIEAALGDPSYQNYNGRGKIQDKIDNIKDGIRRSIDQAINWGSNAVSEVVDSIPSIRSPFGFSDGDPHLRTFDGLSYDFQAAGEFVLARGTSLEIQTRQEPWANSNSVSVNTAVALRVGDAVVGLYTDHASNPLNINGQWVPIADGETISVGGGSIYRNGSLYIVTNPDGDGVWAKVSASHINLRPFINNARADDVAGLLGNNDGIRTNDLALPDGTVLPNPVPVTALYGQFADAWRVTDQTTLFVYGEGESTATYTDRGFPANVVRLEDLDPAVRAAAEQVALNAGLVPGTWEFDSAVLDIALTNDGGFADGVADAPTDGTQPVPVILQLPPKAVADAAVTVEDETVTIDVLANDSDPEGDALQLVSASDVNGGTVSIANGQLVFAPATNFNGDTQLRYTVTDGAGNFTVGTVSVEVTAVNDAPTAVADSYTIRAGQVLVIPSPLGLLRNDIDPDGDSLTVLSHSVGVNGTVEVDADGALRYTPNAGFAGEEVIAYTISDGTLAVTGNVSISVLNAAPTLSITGGASVNEGDPYTLSIVAADADGNPFTIEVDWGSGESVQILTDAQLVALGNTLTHVYADDEDGGNNTTPRTISVTASDGIGATSVRTQIVNIQNVAPTAAVTGADTVNEASVYTLSVGAVTDPGVETRTGYSINWGDGSTDNLTPVQFAAGSFTHTYVDGGTVGTPRTITVSATDEDGTFTLGSKSITVNNVAPTVALTGNNATNEGASYTLNIVGSDVAGAADPLSYDINWGDGSAVQTLTAAQLALVSGNVTHTFADDEDGVVNSTPRTISVTVNDGDGGSATQNKVVNVNNVAPTIALAGAGTATQNQSYTLALGAITDPGTDTVSQYVIRWGDGSTQNVNGGGTVTHTYAVMGPQSILVDLVDEDGTFTNAGTLAVVVNAPTSTLSMEAGPNAGLSEGQALIRTINFSDGQDNGTPGWAYNINYGDGTVVNGTTTVTSIDLNHVYADGNANYTVSVTVQDGFDEGVTDTFTVDVANVAPTASVTGDPAAAEGLPYTLSVGPVTDPGIDTRTGYSIDWGDGNTSTFTAAEWAAAAGNFLHIYADGAGGIGTPRDITISATDEDGTFVLGTKSITVQDAAPTLVLTGNGSSNEGTGYTLNIVGSDVAGAADPLSYDINWGDGSAVQTLTAAQLALVSGNVTHTFADDEDGAVNSTARTISVTVNDGDGGSVTQNKVVNVNNVAPTAAVTGADTVNEASVYTLSVGAVTDPGVETRTGYSINWGDGSTDNLTPVQFAAGSFTHTYADGSSNYTITVSATDEDGTFTLGSKSITVNNVAPTVALTGNNATNEGASYTLNIVGSDVAGAADPLSYDINWGDGSAVQTLTAAQLALVSGNVTHTFADDEDGVVNSTARTISVTVNDGDGGSTNQTKVINVNNVAPDLDATGAATVVAGAVYTLNLANLVDPGTDTLLPNGISVNWGDGNTTTYSALGNVTHTYAAAGNPTIQVSLSDEDGTFLNVASLVLTVTPAGGGNNNPVADDETYTIRPGQLLTVAAPGILDGDTDADGDALTVLAVNVTGLQGALTPLTSGAFTFTPTAGFVGQTSFSYTVSDGLGGTDTGLVTINVVNSAPVADDETYNVHAGAVLNIAAPGILDGDTDADGDALTVLAANITGLQGVLTPLTNGAFTFTPTAGFVGQTSFSYTVSDGFGGTDTGTVTINVTNVAPVADDETYTIRPGQLLTVAAPGILDGDTDADGDALTVLAVNVTGLQGALTPLTSGAFTFTPTAGFVGQTSFSYTVSDGLGGTDTGLVTINVVNSAPVADDESYSVTAGQTLSILAPGILEGDTDADGDALTVLAANITGLQGVLTPQTNGAFTFTPTAGFTGLTSFSYTVSDGFGGTDTATVSIQVNPSNQIITLGRAPERQTGALEWTTAWTNTHVGIVHKADYTNAAESWTAAKFTGASPQLLSGIDIINGDLGVSGQSAATSTVRQEIDGKEALRFNLDQAGTGLTLFLSKLFAQDDGSAFVESGRVRLLDASGGVVGEQVFRADSASGLKQVTVTSATAFNAVEINAGVYQGGNFIYGGYANADGTFGSAVTTDSGGVKHGSEFLLDAVEFQLPVLGVSVA